MREQLTLLAGRLTTAISDHLVPLLATLDNFCRQTGIPRRPALIGDSYRFPSTAAAN